MRLFLADVQVNHRNDEDNAEEYQRRSARAAGFVSFESFINQTYHRLHTAYLSDGTHICPKYADNARIFFETADKACNNDVGNHRGKKGNGDTEENAGTGRAVDFCRVVILLVDALQTAQKYENFERQRVPNDIDDHNSKLGTVR